MRIKKQGHHFANKGPYSQVVMYRCESLDHKDGAQELMLLNLSLQTPWNQSPAKTEFVCSISSYPFCPKLLYIPFLILYLLSLKTEEFQRKGETVTEQDPMRPSHDRPFLSSTYILFVEKLDS